MKQYYNYIRLATDLYELMTSENGKPYKNTLMTMLDECIYHFLEGHNVPIERQGEFLSVMFVDTPAIYEMYKNKKFDN